MLILNDIHLGVNRQGGTTPLSREGLRSYLFGAFEDAMHTAEKHVLILGDLFDQFEVEGRDWIQCYLVLQDYIVRTMGKLTLVAGNHDHSPKALRVSSFEMLCKVLIEQFGPDQIQVIGIDQFAFVGDATLAVAHCSNQETFNARLAEILTLFSSMNGGRILLHANYDNNFAAQSDHSLNVSEQQALAFIEKGASLYLAHEHQARECLAGRVVVFGNQWPTSISDCLNNDAKYAHIMGGGVTKVPTWGWAGVNGYAEIDWRDQGDFDEVSKFVRVIGSASSNEAGDCITAIAKFRAKSKAFVITNAVKIEGIADNEALPEAFEATKAFDVIEFINTNLDPRQQAAVVKLMEVQS